MPTVTDYLSKLLAEGHLASPFGDLRGGYQTSAELAADCIALVAREIETIAAIPLELDAEIRFEKLCSDRLPHIRPQSEVVVFRLAEILERFHINGVRAHAPVSQPIEGVRLTHLMLEAHPEQRPQDSTAMLTLIFSKVSKSLSEGDGYFALDIDRIGRLHLRKVGYQLRPGSAFNVQLEGGQPEYAVFHDGPGAKHHPLLKKDREIFVTLPLFLQYIKDKIGTQATKVNRIG